ncbi:MAG: lysN 2 [Anaerosporomusa subterranea]|jgi:DNA-binding transcriptional MocR family regulator|nr:lysN 2 [Anaerosporomusa subterranea]
MNEQFFDFVSIQLSKDNKDSLYVQLYGALRELILQGKLSHGYLLPPVRKFAAFLTVNPGTVVNAYKLLEQNGYIFSRAGSGSYVAEIHDQVLAEAEQTVFETDMEAFAETLADSIAPIANDCIDLASITPDPEMVPIEDFKNVLIEVIDRDKGYAFTYQEGQGYYPLREAISLYLKPQGVNSIPENMQIISGAQQGIDIVAKALLRYGDYVFTESPTYPGAIAAFRSRGAKIIEISMEEDGINITELEQKLRSFRPKLLYVMPNIQNPTGWSYSLNKRSRLMSLARYYDAIVLEDDYISELNFSNSSLAPLKAIDRDGRGIYLKSFSKLFMPGLRLAFLVTPPHLANTIMSVKHHSDISTAGLTQRAFDLYLRKGIWDKHIASVRNLYAERYQATLDAISRYLPGVTCHSPHGGLTCWLELPKGVSAEKIVQQARDKKVLLTAGTAFFPRRPIDSYLRISFAVADCDKIKQGIQTLGEVIQEQIYRI